MIPIGHPADASALASLSPCLPIQLTVTFTAENGASSRKKRHLNDIGLQFGVYHTRIRSLSSSGWNPSALGDKLCFRFARSDKLWFHPSGKAVDFGHKKGPRKGHSGAGTTNYGSQKRQTLLHDTRFFC